MKKRIKIFPGRFLTLAIALSFFACGDDDSDSDNDEVTPAPKYAVGGTVSGLSGTLVLQNKGGDDKTISLDGDFEFTTKLADGSDYSVTVLSRPSNQDCTVSSGSGTVNGADVTSVKVNCIHKQVWNHPMFIANSISPDGQAADWKPQVAIDNNGSSVIVWQQSYGINSQAYKSEFR